MILLALCLCLAHPPADDAYAAIVARGVAAGREGRLAEAHEALDEALRKDPSRVEGRVELGGLFFLEGKYDDASLELGRALRIKEDVYTRDLLGTALELAGRSDEALEVWNVLEKPRLADVEITGLVHLLDRVARREVGLTQGDLLTPDAVREVRLRLKETEAFERILVLPDPKGDSRADLDLSLLERHGLWTSPWAFIVAEGADAINSYASVSYADLGGLGITVGAQYRWRQNQPQASLLLLWPRPFGMDANLRFSPYEGRQLYDTGSLSLSRYHGFDLAFRRVLGASTVGEVAFTSVERSFRTDGPPLPGGALTGLATTLDRRCLEGRRHILDATGKVLLASSSGFFGRTLVGATYRLFLSPSDGSLVSRSELAARFRWGRGSQRTPLDELFAPGGSPDMELPLRAHPQVVDGTLGSTPLARRITLSNVEWRRRLLNRGPVHLGFVLFSDSAVLGGSPSGRGDLDHTFFDTGLGLRLALGGGPLVRLDYGHGLSDGRNAVFIGLDQVF